MPQLEKEKALLNIVQNVAEEANIRIVDEDQLTQSAQATTANLCTLVLWNVYYDI